MNNVLIPVIPVEVALALEYYRSHIVYSQVDPLNIEAIRRRALADGNAHAKTILRYYDETALNRRNYLAAVLNGYTTVEPLNPSADELRRIAYENIRDKYEHASHFADMFPYDSGYQRGILFVLSELGINIAGLNVEESTEVTYL
ncbi:hypothetical protein [Paenibacillus agricola]|uniref:Uncharacterized protein n=1 Tax=Paenibacillus agricola TaxID=2716264 RepID=A0ABX0JAJ0_9BACL|nr:hypothetical protein [Paenibacillus agricola]NHN31194.1 hypothetical protein [Paenibacillus agricola]